MKTNVGTIQVGTIQEMTGQGYELLVDAGTRSYVLARFFDGRLLTANSDAKGVSHSGSGSYAEETVISSS
jgi:hypothetical protein